MSLIWLFALLLCTGLLKFQFCISASSDEWFTYWRLHRSKKSDGNFYVNDSIQKGFAGSPRFYYKLLSRFKQKNWRLAGDVLNISWDLISIFILYLISKYYVLNELSNYANLKNTDVQIDALLIFTLISYAFAPLLNPITGRLKGIKARTFSNTLIVIVSILIFLIVNFNLYIAILPSAILGVVIILSSAFGAQYFIFMCISLSAMYLTWSPLVVLAGSFILSYNKITGGYFVIRHKINHYRWYSSNYKGTTADRNNIREMFNLKAFIQNPKLLVDQIFYKNTILIVLFNVPVITVVLWFIYSNGYFFTENLVLQYLTKLVLTGTLAFVLTSLHKFLFLGQAERYFEFILFPVYLLFHFIVFIEFENSFYLHSLIILWNITATLINKNKVEPFSRLHRYSDVKQENDENRFQRIREVLDTTKNLSILTVPFKLSFRLSSYLYEPEKWKWYYLFISDQEIDGFDYMLNDTLIYDYPDKDINFYEDKYSINTIVKINNEKSQTYISRDELLKNDYSEVYSDNEFTIYTKKNQ